MHSLQNKRNLTDNKTRKVKQSNSNKSADNKQQQRQKHLDSTTKHFTRWCNARDGILTMIDFTFLIKLVLNQTYRPKLNPDLKSGFKPELLRF